MTVRELNGHVAHSVTYDMDGKPVSVTVQEPRFTLQEKMLLIESRRRSNAPRNEYGWLSSDALNPKNAGRIKATEPVTDLVAKAIGEAEAAWVAKYGPESTKYLRFGAELV